MNWKRFNRGECPVCGGARKDCRQSATTGMVHCRDIDAAPLDYIFRGYDSLGFGMWADRTAAEAWTEEKRQEWQEERRRERERERDLRISIS